MISLTKKNRSGSAATAAASNEPAKVFARSVRISADGVSLAGDLVIPAGAAGVVLFAHGSGSSRHSPRNQFVARTIQASGTGTLLFDLLSVAEEGEDAIDGHLRFDIALLARRLAAAAQWMRQQPEAQRLGIGLFGASTGGAAALVAAAELGSLVQAVVSRGGRPDLAGSALPRVKAPTLLIVGARDEFVVQLNRDACAQLRGEKQLTLVPGATHLFEEPGALDQVASLAAEWFQRFLKPA
jgi:putative phosphoribosyl transferase